MNDERRESLREAAAYALDRLDTMIERQTLTGAEIARETLQRALAAEPPADAPDPDIAALQYAAGLRAEYERGKADAEPPALDVERLAEAMMEAKPYNDYQTIHAYRSKAVRVAAEPARVPMSDWIIRHDKALASVMIVATCVVVIVVMVLR